MPRFEIAMLENVGSTFGEYEIVKFAQSANDGRQLCNGFFFS